MVEAVLVQQGKLLLILVKVEMAVTVLPPLFLELRLPMVVAEGALETLLVVRAEQVVEAMENLALQTETLELRTQVAAVAVVETILTAHQHKAEQAVLA